MSKRKYLYFYNSDGILTHIDKAIKGEIYTGFGGIEFIVRYGDINIKHYAIRNKLNHLAIGGESPEHYNAKMKIVEELKYYDDIFEQDVHFAKVVPEQKINDKIPDLSCYDEKENLVMLIEIKYSNGKDFSDLQKLSKNKVPLVEIDIKNNDKCSHLILTEVLEINKQKLSKIKRVFQQSSESIKYRIEESEREYKNIANRYSPNINIFRESIQNNGTKRILDINEWLQRRFEKTKTKRERRIKSVNFWLQKRFNRKSKEIQRFEYYEEEVQEFQEVIYKLKKSIPKYTEETFKNDYRLGKLESEIATTESEIKQRKNDITKIAEKSKIEWFRNKWMNNTINNKLEEIRYWCS